MMMKNERILTIYEACQSSGNDIIPKIILQGKWLRSLGYITGDKISVKLLSKHDETKFIVSLAD